MKEQLELLITFYLFICEQTSVSTFLLGIGYDMGIYPIFIPFYWVDTHFIPKYLTKNWVHFFQFEICVSHGVINRDLRYILRKKTTTYNYEYSRN